MAKEKVAKGQKDFMIWMEAAANAAMDSDEDLTRQELTRMIYVKPSAWANWRCEIRELPLGTARLFAYQFDINWKKIVKKAIKFTDADRWKEELKAIEEEEKE